MDRKVRLKGTEFDVFVGGHRIGSVTDCGDCWRGWLVDRRRRLRLHNTDFNSRIEAVNAVVAVATR